MSPRVFAQAATTMRTVRVSHFQTSLVSSRRPWTRASPREERSTGRLSGALECTPSGISKTVTELRELDASNYYQFLEEEAGSNLVVVDFYTDWCGPCKLMYPELILMQEQWRDRGVLFVKFNCNAANKSVGKELQIRAAPTFFLYKNGQKIASMTGAKADELRALIREHV